MRTMLWSFLLLQALAAAVCAADLDPKGAEPGYWAKKVHRISGGGIYIDLGVKAQRGDTCNPTSAFMILKHYGIYESISKLKKGGDYRYSDVLSAKLEEFGVKMTPCPTGTEAEFRNTVINAIDRGILLQWTVDLLKAPDSDISRRQKAQMAKTGESGHARVINGYRVVKANRRRDDSGIYFADSWGAGNNRKVMSWSDAFAMTTGLFAVYPENTPDETIAPIVAAAKK